MKPKICFLALNIYPTLAGTKEVQVGGAEVQQCLIARYLVGRGYDVSFVTRDHGQPDKVLIDGITVYKAFKKESGLPYLRFFHPRLTGIWNAMRHANADVYYQRCAGMETGLLAAFCRRYKRKFIFASGSDTDFDPGHVIVRSLRDRYLYTFGLRHADAIVAQTETQSTLLRENFGRNAELIPNCWNEETSPAERRSNEGYVLWVSTLRTWKRPDLFVDLSEQIPDAKFVMVGGPASGEVDYYDGIVQQSGKMPNLSFEGYVPFYQVHEYFDGARVVVNTSEPKEGFPNAFLQAWSRNIPVVSYFDPDGIIRKYELGMAVNSAKEMTVAVASLLNDAELYARMQQNILAYFGCHHRIELLGPRYEGLLDELMA